MQEITNGCKHKGNTCAASHAWGGQFKIRDFVCSPISNALSIWGFGTIMSLFVKEKTHIMLTFILGPRSKELTCMIKFIGRDRAEILMQGL